MKKSFFYSLVLISGLAFASGAYAEDYIVTLKDNKFSPQEIAIPSGQKVKITVKNMDSTPSEFESQDLNREKAIAAGAEVVIAVGPLKPGKYEFFDEFHKDTAKGTITVK